MVLLSLNKWRNACAQRLGLAAGWAFKAVWAHDDAYKGTKILLKTKSQCLSGPSVAAFSLKNKLSFYYITMDASRR
jgi:hypothetical protein